MRGSFATPLCLSLAACTQPAVRAPALGELVPPAERVLLASEPDHELHCAEREGSFFQVARSTVPPAPGAPRPEPWLCSLEVRLWADLDGDGSFDPGERLLCSSSSGDPVSHRTLRTPLPSLGKGAPHLLSVTYQTTTKTHRLPTVRLP